MTKLHFLELPLAAELSGYVYHKQCAGHRAGNLEQLITSMDEEVATTNASVSLQLAA